MAGGGDGLDGVRFGHGLQGRGDRCGGERPQAPAGAAAGAALPPDTSRSPRSLANALALTIALVLLPAPSRRLSSLSHAQALVAIEYSFFAARAALPAPLWARYFLNPRAFGRLTSSVAAGVYLSTKVVLIADRRARTLTLTRVQL